MTPLFSDTRPEAEAVLLNLLRQAPPWRRLQMVSRLNATVRTLAVSGLRQRYPQANEAEIRRRLADLLLGSQLALRVYGPLPIESPEVRGPSLDPLKTNRSMNEQSIEVTLLVTAVLEELGIPYVIGGSLASALHGVARSTVDSDLVASLRPEHVPLLVDRLQSEFYIFDEAAYDAIANRSSFNLIHLASMFKVDIFIPKQRAFDQAQLEHGESYVVALDPERRARIASAEDTVLAKLDWFRMGGAVSDRQWQDVLGILRHQGDKLDDDYLHHMAITLGVEDWLQRAKREAEQAAES